MIIKPNLLTLKQNYLASWNFVPWRVCLRRFVIFSIIAALFSAGNISVLFITTNILSEVIWPMTKHSAVWVCIPLVTSTTSIIRLIICAPPMIVLISEAWPGQSTRVIWSWSKPCSLMWGGAGRLKELNPRSRVIPRAFDSNYKHNVYLLCRKKTVKNFL